MKYTKRLSVTVSTKTIERLEQLEKETGFTKSQLIALAVMHYQPPRKEVASHV